MGMGFMDIQELTSAYVRVKLDLLYGAVAE